MVTNKSDDLRSMLPPLHAYTIISTIQLFGDEVKEKDTANNEDPDSPRAALPNDLCSTSQVLSNLAFGSEGRILRLKIYC